MSAISILTKDSVRPKSKEGPSSYWHLASLCLKQVNLVYNNTQKNIKIACADPEGGAGGPDPPWNLKILLKKGNFGILGGLDPPRL